MKRGFYLIAGALALLAVACGGAVATQQSQTGTTDTGDFAASLQRVWRTDFSKSSISPSELTQGQTKDGIPAIDEPKFLGVSDVDFLGDLEPVISLTVNGETKAFPLQILIWHEIVNDVIGGRPVLVTFCPLCNTAIAFEREVDGEILEFGVWRFGFPSEQRSGDV